MKKILIYAMVLIGIAIGLLYVTGNEHVLVAVQKTYLVGQGGPSIDDFGLFTHRRVEAQPGKPWPDHQPVKSLSESDQQWLDSIQTATFLVIHRDSITAEHYFDEYEADFRPNIFSSAKSLVSMCIGSLVNEGAIDNLDEPASRYIPKLTEKGYDDITIRHLLQMSSGLGFDENYTNPFGYQAKVYYGTHIRENTLAFDAVKPPGKEWFYSGGNTVLLAMIVEAASGQKLANYFAEKVWRPIGAQADAWWTVDQKDDGTERASCCFYAVTRDLARLGQLYLQNGQWEGRQVIPEWYVEESLKPVMLPDSDGDIVEHYGYQWWLGEHEGEEFFQMQGMLGQYIIVVPSRDLVIVRTGHDRSKERVNGLPKDCYRYIEIAKSLLP